MRTSDLFNVLGPIYTEGPLSRSDLAEMMNIAPSQVGVLIRRALNDGCLIEDGYSPSSGGRRRVLLKANPGFANLVGIDIGRSHIRLVVTDFAGKILNYRALPSETDKGRDHVLGLVHEEVSFQLSNFPAVAAIGVTHSGVIDPRAGSVLFWPMVAGWENTPLRQIIEERHGLPTFMVGDSVRAMAITEARFGHGKGLHTFVLVSVGWGIGSAIYIDGHIHIGRHGLAGELGHTTVVEEGEMCSCGNQGCLELYSSALAIIRRVRSELERGVSSRLNQDVEGDLSRLSVEMIGAAAQAHDRLAERIVSEAGTHLGVALASMVNLLDPDKVILTGMVPQMAGDVLLGPLLYNLRQRALPLASADLPVVVSEFGDESAAKGMTLVAGEGVFKARCREIQEKYPHTIMGSAEEAGAPPPAG
jgi:predicted NBD/HSP70 family sugar kinase